MHSTFANQSKNMLLCGMCFKSIILIMLSVCILFSSMPFEAQASAGSYDIKWYAADPAVNNAPYLPTYIKYTPAYLSCPGSAGRYSGSTVLPNAVLYGPTSSTRDALTSLAPRTLALGQIIPFEVEISVSGSTTPENGKIKFSTSFNTNTTSGSNFGFDPAYKVYCAFVDTSDPGTIDPGNNAKVDSYTSGLNGTGTNQYINGTFKVSGLDSGDKVIVEIWVVLKSKLPPGSTGNVQTNLIQAYTANDTKINFGTETIPLLKISDVNEFFTEINDLAVTKTDIPDPVVQGQQLTYNLLLRNNGASNVSNMVIATDTLSPSLSFVTAYNISSYTTSGRNITFNVGALSPGELKIITLVTNVAATAPIGNDTTSNSETGGYSIPTFFDIYNKILICAMCKDADPSNNIYYQPTNVLQAPVYNYTFNQTPKCSNPLKLTVSSTPSYGLSLQIVWKDQNGTLHHSETVEKMGGVYKSVSFIVPPNSGGTWTVEVTEYSGSGGTGNIVGQGTTTFPVTCEVLEFPVGSSLFLLVTGVGYLGMRKKMAGL
ncbi:hypothetical protein [uncultured Methanomethylovorans sp.]|uniref:hypothetical protein n=1 Tax=uncultured Methanomethylovorans sp. TaxID=183759 RepID=UPI002AA6688B|nr:hypothetical protein [uncultured Methanomethylovorans sp.]